MKPLPSRSGSCRINLKEPPDCRGIGVRHVLLVLKRQAFTCIGTALKQGRAIRRIGNRLERLGHAELSWTRNGAQGRNRTTDTAIFSRMLYQLSYLGVLREGPKEKVKAHRAGGL